MFNDLLERYRRGTPLTAQRFNETVDAVNDIRRGLATPRQLSRTGGRVAVQTRRLVISTVGNDVLTCLDVDVGQAERRTFYVARPPLLRSTNAEHNGVAFSAYGANARTATGAEAEAQSLVPPYLEGDRIFAVGPLGDGTGIIDFPQPGNVVVWQDLNVDGRVWATDPE